MFAGQFPTEHKTGEQVGLSVRTQQDKLFILIEGKVFAVGETGRPVQSVVPEPEFAGGVQYRVKIAQDRLVPALNSEEFCGQGGADDGAEIVVSVVGRGVLEEVKLTVDRGLFVQTNQGVGGKQEVEQPNRIIAALDVAGHFVIKRKHHGDFSGAVAAGELAAHLAAEMVDFCAVSLVDQKSGIMVVGQQGAGNKVHVAFECGDFIGGRHLFNR